MTPDEAKKMQGVGTAPCGCWVEFADSNWDPCDPSEAVHQTAYHDSMCAIKKPEAAPPAKKK